MDCSLSGSSVYGIFQARVLEWVAISFSRGSSQPRNWTRGSPTAGRHFTIWATREAQSQRKEMPKNAQKAAQLHSSHMLAKYCSKFSKSGFNNTWTLNFQMFKLDLEKAEEPEIMLPTSVGSSKKQEFQKNIYFCFYWLCQSLSLCGSQQTVENS